jgi:hypothetical protein
LEGVYRETQNLIKSEEIILVSEDTSNLNYGGLTKTKGLGHIERNGTGIKLHSSIAINKEGIPLGKISQEYGVRTEKGKKEARKKNKQVRKNQIAG